MEEISFGELEKAFPFFEHLSEVEKKELAHATTKKMYAKNYVLNTSEKNCIGLIYLSRGSLRMYMVSPEGRDITLFRLQKGDVCVLSVSCVLDAISFDVFIETEKECEVLLVSPAVTKKLSDKNIYVKEFGYEIAAERFSDFVWMIQQILFMKFDKRLAIFLLDEMREEKENAISMTHEKIASYVGSSREVVTRMLQYFQKEKMVKLSRGKITIVDLPKLKKLAR